MPLPQGPGGASDDGGLQVTMLTGRQCEEWLNAVENLAAWEALYARCPWGTAFQRPKYFQVWTEHYRDWTPVLVLGRQAGKLVGLLALAARDHIITGAGAHQAEYHNWICDSEVSADFPRLALDRIRTAYPASRLVLRYLSPGIPADALSVLERDPRTAVRRLACPYMDLSVARIDETLKKKGNKSKLTRLKREGDVAFKAISHEDLCRHIDSVAEQCDFRQGAVNDSCPFTDDPRKGEFHLKWFAADPSVLDVTGLFLKGALISFVMLVHSRRTSHIGILAYAPAYAMHSTSKFHLYFAARALAERGQLEVDMTPGGDAWKERFASRHEIALELIAYPTYVAAARTALNRRLRETLRSVLPQHWRNGLRKAIGGLTAAQPRGARPSGEIASLLTFQLRPADAVADGAAAVLEGNPLATLVDWSTHRARAQRQAILAEALERIEAGETCYARVDRHGDLRAVWLSLSQDVPTASDGPTGKCVTLREFGERPLDVGSPLGQSFLRDVLQTLRAGGVVESVRMALARDDRAARAAIEALGFREGATVGGADAA